MAHDVFISYRSEDKEWADRLCAGLEARNIGCWIAPRDITAGREWAEAIVEAIQHSKSFVLVLSSHSLNARQISREAELADRNGLSIFTFRVENVDPPPGLMYFLGNLQWLDGFGGNFDSALERLAECVGKSAPPVPKLVTPPPPPPQPPASSALPTRNIAMGAAAVLVLGLGGWFAFNRNPEPSSASQTATATEADAKAETEKFLNALKALNYNEAWRLCTAAKRASEPEAKMEENWAAQKNKYGPIEGYQFDHCKQDDPSGIFTCVFKLDYGEGKTATGTYVVERDNGEWGISSSTHTEPKKR